MFDCWIIVLLFLILFFHPKKFGKKNVIKNIKKRSDKTQSTNFISIVT